MHLRFFHWEPYQRSNCRPAFLMSSLVPVRRFQQYEIISARQLLYLIPWSALKNSLPAVETVPIFSFVTYSSDRPGPFPSYLKLVLLPYVKPGSRLFPVLKKNLRFWPPSRNSRSITNLAPPLPAFLVGDVRNFDMEVSSAKAGLPESHIVYTEHMQSLIYST